MKKVQLTPAETSAAVLKFFKNFAAGALEHNLPLVLGKHHSDPYWLHERADWDRLKVQGGWPDGNEATGSRPAAAAPRP